MDFFGIGLGELLLIAVVALIVLGPDRLPSAMRSVGRAIYEFRKAMEPARSAWEDVQREIATGLDVRGKNPTASDAAKPTGNPWAVHPAAEGLSEEERQRFFATGELPEWRLKELDARDVNLRNGDSGSAAASSNDITPLEYPLPHAQGAGDSGLQPGSPLEDLVYPEPGRPVLPGPPDAE